MNFQLWLFRFGVRCPQRNSFMFDNKISVEDSGLYSGCRYI
jgi:hypothetical protein